MAGASSAGDSAAKRVAGAQGHEAIARRLRRIAASLREVDRRVRGLPVERHVGSILDSLAPQGWVVLHDVGTGRGRIDHIAIGPGGLLAVKTEGHRGTISPAGIDRRWLAQAWAERRQLEELAGAPADALLVFSAAYLPGKPFSRQRGVLVLPARMLAANLLARPAILSSERVEELHARVRAALDASATTGA